MQCKFIKGSFGQTFPDAPKKRASGSGVEGLNSVLPET